MLAILAVSMSSSVPYIKENLPLTADQVVYCLRKDFCLSPTDLTSDNTDKIKFLIKIGPRAYPAFHKLLMTRKSHNLVKTGVIDVLMQAEVKPNEFREDAIELLSHDNAMVRKKAVELLGKIGQRADAKLLVPLCDDVLIRTAILESLETLGGPIEAGLLSKWVDSAPKITDADRIRVMKTIETIRIRSEQK